MEPPLSPKRWRVKALSMTTISFSPPSHRRFITCAALAARSLVVKLRAVILLIPFPPEQPPGVSPDFRRRTFCRYSRSMDALTPFPLRSDRTRRNKKSRRKPPQTPGSCGHLPQDIPPSLQWFLRRFPMQGVLQQVCIILRINQFRTHKASLSLHLL